MENVFDMTIDEILAKATKLVCKNEFMFAEAKIGNMKIKIMKAPEKYDVIPKDNNGRKNMIHELQDLDLNQNQIASVMRLSQPMISKILNS